MQHVTSDLVAAIVSDSLIDVGNEYKYESHVLMSKQHCLYMDKFVQHCIKHNNKMPIIIVAYPDGWDCQLI